MPQINFLDHEFNTRSNRIMVAIKFSLPFQTTHSRVRVRTLNRQKIRPTQPEWPWWDRKILRQCMSRSSHKLQVPSEDRVAVL